MIMIIIFLCSLGLVFVLLQCILCYPLILGHTMKTQNTAVQLQLGESLIKFYNEQSTERQSFEGVHELNFRKVDLDNGPMKL